MPRFPPLLSDNYALTDLLSVNANNYLIFSHRVLAMPSKILLSLLLCLLIFLSGCTAFEKMSEPSSQITFDSATYGSGGQEGAPLLPLAEKRTGGEENSNAVPSKSLSSSEQKIIKTAELSIEVTDVRKTLDSIKEIITKEEGTIQSSSVSAGREDRYTGIVTIQIPSDEFDTTQKAFQNLGKVTQSSISAQDVTEEYVDLDARKNALANQLTQYNRILSQAVNVSEILEVQREIERIQVELDRITGRMKYLDNRISFSTITIHLSEPEQVVTSTGYSVASVISDGIAGFSGTVVWLIVLIMTLLPVIIIGIAGYLLYSRWKNRQSG